MPVPLQRLMTDEDSEIIDFYPGEFKIDLNGKRYAWQGMTSTFLLYLIRMTKCII